jgi:hypothetical protein
MHGTRDRLWSVDRVEPKLLRSRRCQSSERACASNGPKLFTRPYLFRTQMPCMHACTPTEAAALGGDERFPGRFGSCTAHLITPSPPAPPTAPPPRSAAISPLPRLPFSLRLPPLLPLRRPSGGRPSPHRPLPAVPVRFSQLHSNPPVRAVASSHCMAARCAPA